MSRVHEIGRGGASTSEVSASHVIGTFLKSLWGELRTLAFVLWEYRRALHSLFTLLLLLRGIISKLLHELQLNIENDTTSWCSAHKSSFCFHPVPLFQAMHGWFKLASQFTHIMPSWPHTTWTGRICYCEWQSANLSALGWRPLSC